MQKKQRTSYVTNNYYIVDSMRSSSESREDDSTDCGPTACTSLVFGSIHWWRFYMPIIHHMRDPVVIWTRIEGAKVVCRHLASVSQPVMISDIHSITRMTTFLVCDYEEDYY